MELKLENGDYISSGGGVKTVSGAEELAQRLTMKLTARRGKFWPMADYGSRLYTLLSGVMPADRETAIREFVAEALADEDNVSLESIDMRIEGEVLRLGLSFNCRGTVVSVNTAIMEEK